MTSNHKADVDKLAAPLAEAIGAHLESQRKKAKRARVDTKAETASLKSAVLPHLTKAVQAGAQRVADVAGTGTPSPTTTLAGAWSYKAAHQINTTTQGQLDAATDDTDTAVDHVFDIRTAGVLAMAAGLISNAINSGAVNYATTLPAATQPTKTWEVTGAHPCTDCSSVDGETVPAATDFSNGAPFPSIHVGCMCTVSFTAASSTSRSQRSTRMAKGDPVGLTSTIKSQFTNDLGDTDKTSVTDLSGAFRRLCQWQAAGHLPTGLTEADTKWLATQCVKELKKRNPDSEASMDSFPALGESKAAAATADRRCQALVDALKAAASDETGNDTRMASKASRRDASLSFGDVQSLLYAAVVAAMPSGQGDIWIRDCGTDWVVWHDYDKGGDFRVGYSIGDDNAVSFSGQPVAVAEQTTYVPVGSQTLDDGSAGETRADKVKCDLCKGTGKIREGKVTCPDCKGSGEVDPDVAATTEAAGSAPRGHIRPSRRQRRTLERLPERRTFRTQFERRVEQDGNEIVLTGYPIRYSTAYDVHDFAGLFRERMHPGVADDVMGSRDFDCRFLVNHEGMPHARTANGTLVLTSATRGVKSEVHLDARRQDSNDLGYAVERGDVTQMSCGFCVATDEWNWADDGVEERDVYSFADLFDVSAVTYPASPTTSIQLAQRMLVDAASQTRERIRRFHELAGTIRAGKALSQRDGESLRTMAEALYRAERFAPVPELLDAYARVTDRFAAIFRAGKVLSADNEQALQNALDSLHAADDIDIPGITAQLETIDKALDAGQAGLAEVLGKANPDGDTADKNPTLVPSTSKTSDTDARQRQAQMIRLRSARQLLVG